MATAQNRQGICLEVFKISFFTQEIYQRARAVVGCNYNLLDFVANF